MLRFAEDSTRTHMYGCPRTRKVAGAVYLDNRERPGLGQA
jgi:hypothetical protein